MLHRSEEIKTIFKALNEFKNKTKLTNIKTIGAKIRLGYTEKEMFQDKVYLPILQSANTYLDYLTVHPRHASLPVNSQVPDYNVIGEMKLLAGADLKIIGNADITDNASLERMLDTGCDGVMLGRGAINNPWIFRHLLDDSCNLWPNIKEVEEAERVSIEWEDRWREVNGGHIRNKYLTFRAANFERLKHFAITGEMIVTGNKGIREQKREFLKTLAKK